ncbi:MAG: Mrp/NBP35 family ATP-binding protein [Acidobacteria bacterium]|nr:Mrp/NBP35 family ATP-binding protein [Acidobacteriota bacterium]
MDDASPASVPRPTSDDIFGVLRGVIDPELGSNIVELGMAKSAKISDAGKVELTIALTTAGCPLRAQIQSDVRSRVNSLPGVTGISINWDVLDQAEKAALMETARRNVATDAPDTEVPLNTRVLMVASGKGGVGKSSITVNLAAAIAAKGFTVGVLDADIWGYSVPRMLGVEGRLAGAEGQKKILPNTRKIGAGHVEIVSMGFLVEDEETALMWRGLMLDRAVRHFLEDVRWGDLDYLFIDMPPGTGDVQMGLARMLPRAEMLVVTTPALAAQKVASRVANMGRNNYLRIVGVIENMTAFVAPDGTSHELFGHGGGQALADEIGAPLLASIPLDKSVAPSGDAGEPVSLGSGPAADALSSLADLIVEEAAPPIDRAGCTVRLLDAANAALDAQLG